MSENKGIKKTPTKKMMYLVLCGVAILIGIGFLAGYILSGMNMFMAFIGVIFAGPGIFGFWYFWKGESELFTKDVHKIKFDEKANSICHYRHDIVMQYIENPPGNKIEFENVKEKFYDLYFDGEYGEDGLEPRAFLLPDKGATGITPVEMARDFVDQKEVKEFIQKKKSSSKAALLIKRGILVVVILILWILIITTT